MTERKHTASLAALLCAVGLLTIAQQASAITIAAARATPVGTPVSLTNVVISSLYDNTFSGSVKSIQLQDATGGITVVDSQSTLDLLLAGLTEGDAINMDGPIGLFNGLVQLGFSVGPVAGPLSHPGVPADQVITPAALVDLNPLAETLESERVRLNSVTFTGLLPGQTFNGGTNYTVTDGLLSGIVRLGNDIGTPHPLQGVLIPTGPVNITGIMSQFDTTAPAGTVPGRGYQVLALNVSAVPEPCSFVLVGIGLASAVLMRRRSR
jgi:hypothetical protein